MVSDWWCRVTVGTVSAVHPYFLATAWNSVSVPCYRYCLCVMLLMSMGMSALAADQADGFVDLIKADSLDGWHLVVRQNDRSPPSKKPNWEVKNGILINTTPGRHLASDEKYRDFELAFDFQVPAKCNNGAYLRGRYELKLKDANPLETPPTQRCGAIYNQIAPAVNAYIGPRKWNKCSVVLEDNELTVVMNDKVLIEKRQLDGPTAGAFSLEEDEPGRLVLHSHAAGAGITYRGMRIKRLNE